MRDASRRRTRTTTWYDTVMPFSEADQRVLLATARQSIEQAVHTRCAMTVDLARYPSTLHSTRASFVTLKLAGELRGCMGVIQALRPVVADVAHNAFAAGYRDPRFDPLTMAEIRDIRIELSVLTAPEPLAFTDEAHALGQLRAGVDGLILADVALQRRGTFLPTVWQSLPDPRDFWAHLKQKAGLPVDHWSATMKLWRYTTETIIERE